jgi:hypothetical protein
MGVYPIPNDLFNSMVKAVRNGGSIFYDRVPGGTSNATATGTGTSRTSISTTYSIPDLSTELLAISPGLSSTADAAANQKFGFVDIQGAFYKKQPQQVIAPIGSVALSVGATRFTSQEWYCVRAPTKTADQYDWGFTPLISNANNMSAWVDIMLATTPSGDPTIFSQVQTTTTAFKTAGTNSAGNLTLTAASALYEIATGLSPESAGVAGETQIVSTQVQCSSLYPIQTFTFGVDPPAQITATSGDTQLGQISRYMPLNMSFKQSNPQLNFSHILKTAPTNNITTSNMVRYTSY